MKNNFIYKERFIMEKTLRKACNYGNKAKFWETVAKICDKIGKFATNKGIVNRQSQKTLLRSVITDVNTDVIKPNVKFN